MAASAAADSGCGVDLNATGGFLVLGSDSIPVARRRGVYELTARLVPSGCLVPATAAGCSRGRGGARPFWL
eukprot:926155-Amphidinium_carterae.1